MEHQNHLGKCGYLASRYRCIAKCKCEGTQLKIKRNKPDLNLKSLKEKKSVVSFL